MKGHNEKPRAAVHPAATREERLLVKELIQGLVVGFLAGVLVAYFVFA